jgi:hypothetical protein
MMIGSTPLGGAITGFVADQLTVRTALAFNASVCLVGLVLSALYLRRRTMAPPSVRASG